MKKLHITISGHCNSGKSAISTLIAETLLERGFSVEVTDEPLHPTFHQFQEQRLDALRRAPLLVDINVVNLPRSFLAPDSKVC